jgi:imidazolonepropionase-like amidohydrolase
VATPPSPAAGRLGRVRSGGPRVNAELFRMDKEIGSVEPGKFADLIAVKGNPLKDLGVFQNPDNLHLIMKGGAVYKRTF